MPSPDAPSENQVPLVVDMDGTLIKTDMLWEGYVRLLKKNPLHVFLAMIWLFRGRAFLKRQLAARVFIDPASLPYNEPFLGWLAGEKSAGRKIILATASDLQMAKAVAGHAGVFDEVLGSDGRQNLRGGNKLEALVKKFGARGFDYAGNSGPDLAVWRAARGAVVVNACRSLENKAARCAKVVKVFPPGAGACRAFIRALRPHQWAKNLIIFAPIVAAHKLNEPALLLQGMLAFAVFCLCSSGVYIVNDLMDLDADRRHRAKKFRPFAAGDLPLSWGLLFAPALLATGLAAATRLSWLFVGVTAAYLFLTTAYSLWIKRVVLLDVFVLAGLYTIRLIAGHAATDIVYSSWLLVFSMFIFLSLALVKRYVELAGTEQLKSGRGYNPGDMEIVASLGTGSGYLAALVLALYVNSQQVVALYQHPNLLLLLCPLLLYWVSRVWLLAHRGQMHDDPVYFAVKDPASYIIGLLVLATMWMSAIK
jgi:4-hydroxybenzoate polyprenyltransferase